MSGDATLDRSGKITLHPNVLAKSELPELETLADEDRFLVCDYDPANNLSLIHI